MPEKTRIGLVPASRSFFSKPLAKEMKEMTIRSMEAAGLQVVTTPEDLTPNGLVETRDDALKCADLFAREKVIGAVIGAMNFGNEIPAAEAVSAKTPGLPVFVFGCKEEGELTLDADRRDAFCGTLSIAAALRRRLIAYTFPRTPVCFPEGEEFIQDVSDFAASCRVVNGVRNSRYGLVGPRPAEFETCAFDELSLLRDFNITVVPVPLSQVFGDANSLKDDDSEVTAIVESIKSVADVSRVQECSLLRSAKLEVVLRRFVSDQDLDGLGIQCWTSIQEHYHICSCLAMSRLNNEGISCACETDIHGAVSMRALHLAAQAPSGLADWDNQHYADPNVFSAWHCGVYPPEFAREKPKVWVHSITGATVGMENAECTIEFESKLGPVTLARLTESTKGDFKLLIAEGEVVEMPGKARGTHGWVRVHDLNELYKALLRDFPHHTAIAYGHHGRALVEACTLMGITPVVPNPLERM